MTTRSAARQKPSAEKPILEQISDQSGALADTFARAGVPAGDPAYDRLQEASSRAKAVVVDRLESERPLPRKIELSSVPNYLTHDASLLVLIELGAKSLDPAAVGRDLYSLTGSRVPVTAALHLEQKGSLDAWRQMAPGQGKAQAQSAALIVQPRFQEGALVQPAIAQISSGRGAATTALLTALGGATRNILSSSDELKFDPESEPNSLVVAWVLNNADQEQSRSFIKTDLLARSLALYGYRQIGNNVDVSLPQGKLASQFQAERLIFGASGVNY